MFNTNRRITINLLIVLLLNIFRLTITIYQATEPIKNKIKIFIIYNLLISIGFIISSQIENVINNKKKLYFLLIILLRTVKKLWFK